MRTTLATAMIGAGAATLFFAGMTGDAFALTHTITTVGASSHEEAATIRTGGYVTPAPGNTPKVAVLLFKKAHDGSWNRVAKTHGVWSPATGEGRGFTASLSPAPTSGQCKIVARYPGNDTFAKSHGSSRIDCRTASVQ